MKNIFSAIIFLFGLNSQALGQKRSCDNKEFKMAEDNLVSVEKTLKKSNDPWSELSSVFAIWEPCKEKFQDEAFIDIIAELAVSRWDKISDLKKIKIKNLKFYKYVILSLGDVTVEAERWNIILNLAKNKCPAGAKEICTDIERAHRTR